MTCVALQPARTEPSNEHRKAQFASEQPSVAVTLEELTGVLDRPEMEATGITVSTVHV